MNEIEYTKLLALAIKATKAASAEILKIYDSGDFQAEAKGDQSPLTIADKRAHQLIASILQPSNLPILSEEGKSIPYEVRKDWEYFWMVDPLDGTKEFIRKNGEFTVNIALIKKQTPILGVIGVPVTNEIYYGMKGQGAFMMRDGISTELEKRNPIDWDKKNIRVIASRSHMTDETQQFINRLKEPILVSAGSSLKFILLAVCKADIYPRFGPTMEWDTAAGHAIVNELNLRVVSPDNEMDLKYNKPSLLNSYFLCL